ncbi:MAG: hypothetical protein ISS69_10185 [Phycisphaerae bacterium]|nr:hypothetical protein [Phycisphaerae bacterium]
MAYDHHDKAGNQGDVVKHVALIAALDTIVAAQPGRKFSYADVFAGHPWHHLLTGNEWKSGIGKLHRNSGLNGNPHIGLWSKWYLDGRPDLLYGMYPGSSVIAWDVCRYRNIPVRLSLWDISPDVIRDLMVVFGDGKHSIHGRPAVADEQDLSEADFILIDPPGLQSRNQPAYPAWDDLVRLADSVSDQAGFLIWLPVNANTSGGKGNVRECQHASDCRENSVGRNWHVTKVRWSIGGRTIGCQLVYRLPADAVSALRIAVDHVTHCVGWCVSHFPDSNGLRL